MPEVHSVSTVVDRPNGRQNNAQMFRHVMACLDRSSGAAHVLEQAALLANQTGADLTAMRVIPAGLPPGHCADPVDWEFTRRDESADLVRIADTAGVTNDIRTIVTCGSAVRCIHDEALRCDVDVLVLGAGTFGLSRGRIGGIARQIAEAFHGSVLIVPDEIAGERSRNRRIIVPMDGSPSSEAALRFASAIARARAADLVILHAVSQFGPLGNGQTVQANQALWRDLEDEAVRSADDRLQRLYRLLPVHRHGNRIRRLSGDAPRRALMKAICEEWGELLVLSARGLGDDPDLAIGSTAEYLLCRAVTPVLLIRTAEISNHRAGGTAPRSLAALWQKP